MSLLADTLFPAAAPRRTAGALLRWWESRRLFYNVVVGVTGLVSLAVVATFAALPPSAHFRIGPQPIVVYGVMANVCYSFGWLIEMASQRLWQERCVPLGPVLFRQGLALSVGVTALPIVAAGASWVFRVGLAIVR